MYQDLEHIQRSTPRNTTEVYKNSSFSQLRALNIMKNRCGQIMTVHKSEVDLPSE